MKRVSTTIVRGLAAGLLLAGAAGCGPEEEPESPPSTIPGLDAEDDGVAGPGSESPGATGPVAIGSEVSGALPEPDAVKPDPADFPHMGEKTLQGAEEAYVYFWEMYTYGLASGDGGEFRTLFADECGFCQAAIETMDVHAAENVYLVGAEMEIVEIVSGVHDDDTYIVDLGITMTEHQKIEENVGAVDSESGSSVVASGALTWDSSRWVVEDTIGERRLQ